MGERYSSVMAKAWAKAEEWNAAHPVGTKVRVSGEGIKTYETFTRSAAYVWGNQGHVAVMVAAGPIHSPTLEQLVPL